MGTNGMVATSQPMAVQAGLEVLKQGGNALDAAVAASATLCVTEPQSTGIGGDCFILHYEAKSQRLYGLNGSGSAPARASLEAYQAEGYQKMPVHGPHAITVPGAIHAWETALARFGTKGLDTLLQPAIDYAQNGYAVSSVVGMVWKNSEGLLRKDEAAAKALLPNGEAPRVGSIHCQERLGYTLKRIAKQGAKGFYRGETAQEICRYVQQLGGFLTEEDLANHTSEWVVPIRTSYRGLDVYEIPPNGQGIAALMALNMLEHADLGSMDALGAERLHMFAETYSISIAERNRWIGDMNFSQIPIEALLDKGFARQQWERIDPSQAMPQPMQAGLSPSPHKDTVYITVVDKDRNCCSFINSLFHGFGSGIMGGESGVMLQNRGAGFVLEAGHPNQIEAGKRPMHTIIPAMVMRGNKPILSYGVMGGQYQTMGHCYVLSNWVDNGMDLQEAIDAPRFLPEGDKLMVERSVPRKTQETLEKMGHQVEETEMPHGGGQAIFIDHESGVLSAGSDPRKDGCAMGY